VGPRWLKYLSPVGLPCASSSAFTNFGNQNCSATNCSGGMLDDMHVNNGQGLGQILIKLLYGDVDNLDILLGPLLVHLGILNAMDHV
jgi:hypothetical protein